MKNIDKKRNVYRKRNMIMIFVMHILLASFLVGCDNAGLMKDRESGYEGKAYYVNSLGIRVSRIYYLQYERPGHFDERGYARVTKCIKSHKKRMMEKDEVYFIDKKFNVVGDRFFKFGEVEKYLYNGQDIFVTKADNALEILDENFNMISSIPYVFKGDEELFCVIDAPGENGLFPFRDSKSDKWGYMTIEGEIVIEPKFDGAKTFHEGMAVVEQDFLCGTIDENGDYIIEPVFHDIEKFYNGQSFARVSEEYNYVVIDAKGEIIKDNMSYSDKEDLIENDPNWKGYSEYEDNRDEDHVYKLICKDRH